MRTDVCVIGGGPAGSTLATRLAQLGHDVCLVERSRFPRRRLGESLSPGVLPLLDMTGARAAVERAGFTPVRSVSVSWDAGEEEREDERQQGLLVDRGRFDRILLAGAAAAGVRVMQPAHVLERVAHKLGWSLRVGTATRNVAIEARFIADATGRAATPRARRRRTGPRTIALYAYWRGTGLPPQPRIESGADEWFWGVPLPDGTYNTLVFVDAARLKSSPQTPLERRFRELIERSSLMARCRGARRVSPVRAADATPYLDEDAVTARSIKVGDSALAIDPLSSSGVQKAVQSALSGAIVVNTLLRRPDSADAAMRFHRDSLAGASRRHSQWAASHYASVLRRAGTPFWVQRAAKAGTVDAVGTDTGTADSAASRAGAPAAEGEARALAGAALELSPSLEFVDVPCMDEEFVTVRQAIRHPALDGPLAYLGGAEVAPLLRGLRPGATALEAVRSWSDRVPLERGLMLAGWLVSRGLLVRREA